LAGSGGNQKGPGGSWLDVGTLNDPAFEEKPIKLVELANGNFLLVKYDADNMFVTACNSTAFQYPLIDGELFYGAAGRAWVP
jgi:hypothetical protein